MSSFLCSIISFEALHASSLSQNNVSNLPVDRIFQNVKRQSTINTLDARAFSRAIEHARTLVSPQCYAINN